MTLSADQLDTLRQLSRKKAGAEIGWVRIAAARELTVLGLALRSPSGWQITADGEASVGSHDEADTRGGPHVTLQFRPRGHA
jgi:hypothetical protein